MLTDTERKLIARLNRGEDLTTDEKIAAREAEMREQRAAKAADDALPMTKGQGRTIVRILTFWNVLVIIGIVAGFFYAIANIR